MNTPSARFAGIIEYLCQAVAARGVKGAFASPLLTLLLWNRLRFIAARFKAIASAPRYATPPRRRARTRPPAPPREPEPAPAPSEPASPEPEALRLPRRFAWLLAPLPESRTAASQLRFFLGDPRVAAMIEADPRFGRLLRPLCHSLGIRPPPCLCIARSPNPSEPAAPEPRTNTAPETPSMRHIPFHVQVPPQPGRAIQPVLCRAIARAPP
ncbi:hypothetical protein AiwAL_09050 [Acidiphilium sp. AL]|nr:hypothetical protein [Acidiphilium sp. AL]